MPDIDRPDGARIHYDVRGTGFPVVLLAPGGPGGEIVDWLHAPVDPRTAFGDGFQVITVDQRFAGISRGPIQPFDYTTAAADVIAVLDALDVAAAHLVTGGQTTALAWRLVLDAPERFRSVVALAPVGVAGDARHGDFLGVYEPAMRLPRSAFFDDPESEGMAAVVEAAGRDGSFTANPEAGPFARAIAADRVFAEQVVALRREKYITQLVRYRDGVWPAGRTFFSVADDELATITAPVLITPGTGGLTPEAAATRLAAELPATTLESGADSTTTLAAIAGFLSQNTPSRQEARP